MFHGRLHWRVLAVSPCFYCVFQVTAGFRGLLGYALDGILDAPPDVYPGTFHGITGGTLAAAEAECT